MRPVEERTLRGLPAPLGGQHWDSGVPAWGAGEGTEHPFRESVGENFPNLRKSWPHKSRKLVGGKVTVAGAAAGPVLPSHPLLVP